MNYNTLNRLIKQGLSTRQAAEQLSCSQTNIRYWLKKHKIKQNKKKEKNFNKDKKICPRCQQKKLLKEFYHRRNKSDTSPYCRLCSNKQTVERQRVFKQKCIEYKGGSCKICKYDKCVRALEFHHINKHKKKFSISKIRLTTFSNKTRKELDKCILLCSNCHRETHEKMRTY